MNIFNTLTQCIIAKQTQLTTVACPQKIPFRNIKRKRRAKTESYAQIQILSPPVDEVLTENEKTKNNS